LTSGIQVNPTDLNQTFNQVEYQYPNTNIKDQLDFIFISLQDDLPGLLSENEPINKLSLKNDFVNNYVQAKFIAIRRILQGREDLIITLKTDYSGIQVEAGDVIRVTNETYGWTDKLFRVSNVVEEKDADGNLFASLTGFEYNGSIYDDDLDITDFIPADNTGLQDPNIIGVPDAPIVVANTNTTLNFLNISGNVPNVGLVLNLDFNYGFDSNTSNHLYYTTVNNGNGAPLIPSNAYTINVNDIEQSGNIFWSTTARNRSVGVKSNASTSTTWAGANVSTFDGNNGGVGYNNINPSGTPQERIASVAYGIADVAGNTVTLPVSVNANSITNQPVYIDGANTNPNYYYPYYQGTSTTANGYLANSTASFTPARAVFQVINNGDDDWYGYIYDNFGNTSNYPLKNDESFLLDVGTILVANADSTVKIGAFYTVNTLPGTIFHSNELEGTYVLPANVPIEINFTHGYDEAANNTLDGGGFIIKNMSANTRVNVVYSSLQQFKVRFQ
jgi:hypothetical protein